MYMQGFIRRGEEQTGHPCFHPTINPKRARTCLILRASILPFDEIAKTSMPVVIHTMPVKTNTAADAEPFLGLVKLP